MPKPENIKDKGFDKNPQNINMNGRPKKTISVVNSELESLGYTEATKQDITSCYLRLIQIPIPELENKVKDGTQPALVRIVGKAILSGKGFDVIERVLDRVIGKPPGSMELTGKDGSPLNTSPTVIIQYEGKQIDLKT